MPISDQLQETPRHGMHCIRRCGGPNQCLVVFVHGLGGHIVRTWGKFPELLWQDDSLGKWDLGFFGYHTSLINPLAPVFLTLGKWVPFVRKYPFKAQGRSLADALANLVQGDNYAELVLVGHSLGGLVILEGVRKLLEIGAEKSETADRIRAIVFYGTPFAGSDRVNPLVAKVSDNLKTLLDHNPDLAELMSWLRERDGDKGTMGNLIRLDKSYADRGVLYSARDRWVDVESAKAQSPEGLNYQWDVSHTKLCKPNQREDPSYVLLSYYLNKPSRPDLDLKSEKSDLPSVKFLSSSDSKDLKEARKLYEGLDRLPKDERDSWEVIMGWIKEAEGPGYQGSPPILLVSKVKNRVVAMAFTQYKPGERYAWLAYLVTAKGKERPEGTPTDLGISLGRQIIKELQRWIGEKFRGVYFENDDPNALSITKDKRLERTARIRLFAKKGVYRVTGLNYLQPRLSPDSEDKEVPMYFVFVPSPPTDQLRFLEKSEVVEMLTSLANLQYSAFQDHPHREKYRRYLYEEWLKKLTEPLPLCVPVKLLEEERRTPRAPNA